MFEPALRSPRFGGRQVTISSRDPRVGFNLMGFHHNFSRLTWRQVAEISCELGAGFEPGALKPPSIEAVPFDKAVGAYSRLAAR
jgi:hypothetical protein